MTLEDSYPMFIFKYNLDMNSIIQLYSRFDESKMIGYEKICANILKRLNDCLAIPFSQIEQPLFYGECRSSRCKLHLIVPIFEKEDAFMSTKYRDIPLMRSSFRSDRGNDQYVTDSPIAA